jgi:hypothetical protein
MIPKKTFFVTWQDAQTRRWFPVGRLERDEEGTYRFVYIQGMKKAMQESNLQPFAAFPDIYKTYCSSEIFSFFANRVMPASRPDFADYMSWFAESKEEKDPLIFLARSGGERRTDAIEVFPAPERHTDGSHSMIFFLSGIRHVSECAQKRAECLEMGERLLLLWDLQNPVDPDAILARVHRKESGDTDNIGYLPRYLSTDILDCLREQRDACNLEVYHINPDPAPIQYRVLCKLTFLPHAPIIPLNRPEFSPLET